MAQFASKAFVEKDEAIAVLAAAARLDVGHRAWLQMGGERLIFAAMQAAGEGREGGESGLGRGERKNCRNERFGPGRGPFEAANMRRNRNGVSGGFCSGALVAPRGPRAHAKGPRSD